MKHWANGTAQTVEHSICHRMEYNSYPEDEVEEEQHVFDAFSTAFDSHGERSTDGFGAELWGTAASVGHLSQRATDWTTTRLRTATVARKEKHTQLLPPTDLWATPSQSGRNHTAHFRWPLQNKETENCVLILFRTVKSYAVFPSPVHLVLFHLRTFLLTDLKEEIEIMK